MTTVCSEAEKGPDCDFYGAKLEVPSVHPGLMAACLPWAGGFDFKQRLLESEDIACIITLCRDKGEGRVSLAASRDPDAPPVALSTVFSR